MFGKTRDGSSFFGKKHIYFSSHKDDREYYLKEFSEDIFIFTNCVIWHNDGEESLTPNSEFFYENLDLVVIPVTENYVYDDCFAKSVELEIFKKNDVPLLPIITDDSLFSVANELFGNRQVLEHRITDNTKISYYNKLELFLRSIILKEAVFESYDTVFKQNLFISYRKKDRRIALELIRAIHKKESMRNVGIWYDEFLTLGEPFDDEIKNSIKNASDVVMLITPHTLEKDNYIITDEYPFSYTNNKNIIGVFADGITPDDASKIFPKIEHFISLDDPSFSEKLENLLSKKTEFPTAPKDLFWLGASYMSGRGVEKNPDFAIDFLSRSAKSGFAKASRLLSESFGHGIGIRQDLEKEISWAENYCENAFSEWLSDKTLEKETEIVDAHLFLANIYEKNDMTDKADEVYEGIFSDCYEFDDRKAHLQNIAHVSTTFGTSLLNRGEYKKAEKLLCHALNVYDEMEECDPDIIIKKGYEIAELDYNLATVYMQLRKTEAAIGLFGKTIATIKKYADESAEEYNDLLIKALGNLAVIYKRIGLSSGNDQALSAAEQLMKESVSIAEKMLCTKRDTFEPVLAKSADILATFYMTVGYFEEAEKYFCLAIDSYINVQKRTKGDFGIEIALSSINYSILCRETNRLDLALKYAMSATSIFKQHWLKAPQKYNLMYAKGLMNIAKIHELLNDFERSKTMYDASFKIFRLINGDTDDIISSVGECHFEYGILLMKTNETELAKQYFIVAKKNFLLREDIAARYKQLIDEIDSKIAMISGDIPQ